jgi:anti-sigma factor RsiW
MSASRKIVDDCMRFSAWVAPYVDGELDPGHAVEMEAHVVSCSVCAERVALIRAMRTSLKRTAMRAAPPELCARIRTTIAQEKARAPRQDPRTEATNAKLIRLRYAVGLAAAAGVAFAMGMSRHASQRQYPPYPIGSEHPSMTESDISSSMSIDGLLDELVRLHASPLPPETTDPNQLDRFDPFLGVQVPRPAFQPFRASFKGARMHPVSDRGTFLQVQYSVPDGKDGKRVTMYVFNPRVLPVQATRLEPRVVRQRAMLVGRLRGYSVAALEQSGVGYAFASDLDTDESTKIVLAAVPQ